MGQACGIHEGEEKSILFLFGKPKGMRLLERHGHRSEINMNTDLREYNIEHGLG